MKEWRSLDFIAHETAAAHLPAQKVIADWAYVTADDEPLLQVDGLVWGRSVTSEPTITDPVLIFGCHLERWKITHGNAVTYWLMRLRREAEGTVTYEQWNKVLRERAMARLAEDSAEKAAPKAAPQDKWLSANPRDKWLSATP